MKIIDVENHFYDQCVIDALKKRLDPPFYDAEKDVIRWTDDIEMPQEIMLPLLLDAAGKRKEILKKNGITSAVLSCSAGPEQLEVKESIKVCKKTNAALYEITRQFPGFYLGSAILPVSDVQAACEEMERCVKEYHFVAWHTHSNYGEHKVYEEQYHLLFKKANELGIYIYLHPHVPFTPELSEYGFNFAAGLGFTVDMLITTVNLILSGIFDEYPGLKMVLGHLGEAFPFLLERIDNRMFFFQNPRIKAKHKLRYYFKNNIIVSTSGNMSKEAFECTRSVLGIKNICFSSDFPYESVDEMMNFMNSLALTEEEKDQIFYKTAVHKLHISD